jgi:hypothetical protein
MNYLNECPFCNQDEEIDVTDIASSSDNEESNNRNSHQTIKDKLFSSLTAGSNKCSNCDDCNDHLEQLFSCLFGYRLKSAKYLSNHSVVPIEYTLKNCPSLYNYFKPSIKNLQKLILQCVCLSIIL